ncbi:MAG: glycoside hydrolase family 25 protein, partial [Candidatus Nanopelagicaceae bacterium]
SHRVLGLIGHNGAVIFRPIVMFVVAISLITLPVPAIQAAKPSTTFFLAQTPGFPESQLTFHGLVKPKVKNAIVRIDVKLKSGWRDTKLRTKTTASGSWRIQSKVTAFDTTATYRAIVEIGKKRYATKSKSIKIKERPQITAPESLIPLTGPGGRIHGTDVSRWQHPGDKPIDFVKMYNAGIRFVMIKASDTRDEADALALKFLLMDRNAAQAAGIYTGYYHYTILPNTTDEQAVIRDAQAQAQKAIWRLSSLGGYTDRDLPYALDLENNCVLISGSVCRKYAPKKLVTLWAETWMETMYEKTGRKPFFYSYPTFLEQAMVRSEKLREYPLWKAQYGVDPADPIAEPGRKIFGCFVHSWSTANCSSLWQIWQYSSCGIGEKYGVASARIDLNVFRGNTFAFLQLTKGDWVPQTGDYLPVNEPTSLLVTSIRATSTDKRTALTVEVKRPNNQPVVTGTVAFKLANDPAARVTQSPVRDASGVWTLYLSKLPAGITTGSVIYVDQTNTHARSEQQISFELLQGPEPTPSPTQTPKPVRPPVDTCKNQIVN